MRGALLVFAVVVGVVGAAAPPRCPGGEPSSRARRRRELVFPEGSSYTVALSYGIYYEVHVSLLPAVVGELTVGWELPQATLRRPLRSPTDPFRRHRSERRLLRRSIDALLHQDAGVFGADCTERARCEASRLPPPPPGAPASLIHSALRLLFTEPHAKYSGSHAKDKERGPSDCSTSHACPFSLLYVDTADLL